MKKTYIAPAICLLHIHEKDIYRPGYLPAPHPGSASKRFRQFCKDGRRTFP